MVKFKYVNNPDKLKSELKRLNEFQVVDKTFYECKQEILNDYNGEFEKVGRLKTGDQIRMTHIVVRNISY